MKKLPKTNLTFSSIENWLGRVPTGIAASMLEELDKTNLAFSSMEASLGLVPTGVAATMLEELDKTNLAFSSMEASLGLVPAGAAATMLEELDKTNLAFSSMEASLGLVPTGAAASMLEELDKTNLAFSSVEASLGLVPAGAAATMLEELDKTNLAFSSLEDSLGLVPAGAAATMDHFIKNNFADAGLEGILAQTPLEVSSILQQFEKIGLSSTDILTQFADTIHTIYPKQTITGNIRVGTPSVKAPEVEQGTNHEQVYNSQSLLYILLFFFLKSLWDGIVIPQFNDRYITPKIDSYLASEVSSSDKEKIYHIRNITKGSKTVNIEKSRFVTGNNVRLRRGPSTKEEIIVELDFGQVVTTISKQRDWIEVACVYDGESLQGWVFKRYIGKFK